MRSAIEHEATVISCRGRGIFIVHIRPASSDTCSGCAMATACRTGSRTGAPVELYASGDAFSESITPGIRVTVSPAGGTTARAATLLMALPLAGMLCGVAAGIWSGATDGATALTALAGTAAGFIPALASHRRRQNAGWKITGLVPDGDKNPE